MSIDLCAGALQKGDPDRFLAVMAAPPQFRDDLFVLYTFNLELARASWVSKEPLISQMRLQWWQDAIEEIYAKKTPLRQHEVILPLAELISRRALPKSLFEEMIEARQGEARKEGFQSVDALLQFISHTGANLMRLAGLASGGRETEASLALAKAAAYAQFLAALHPLYKAGYALLPLSDQEAQRAFLNAEPQEEAMTLVRKLAGFGLDAEKTYRKAKLDQGGRVAALAAWQSYPILSAVAQNPEHVFNEAFKPSEFRTKFRLLKHSMMMRF